MRLKVIALLLALLTVIALLAWANWPEAAPLPAGTRVERIVVRKAERVMELESGGVVVRRYRVSLGRVPVGAKEREGDRKTPEGLYRIDDRNPRSCCHLSLHISYPSPEDTRRAAARGESPGSLIMIHGLRNGFGWLGRLHRLADWTYGCIAVTDAEMDELWRVVADGTPILITP
ncbi:MAG: L,D-transpeptidase family protein [Holophagales bacterium]|nr:MAG: L,D-transpeptidase family protein [Holophagales bacterium]